MKKKSIIFVSIMWALLCSLVLVNDKKVYAYDGKTMETAIPIGIDQEKMEFTKGGGDVLEETIYLKVTIPEDIENKNIRFYMSNYGDKSWKEMTMELLDSLGRTLRSTSVYNGYSTRILTQMEGSAGYSTNDVRLCAGSVYFLKLYPEYNDYGKYYISVTSIEDDNWGTYDEAEELSYNQKTYGQIEEWLDIDCFFVELPKDNKKYDFILSGNQKVKAYLVNTDEENLGTIQAAFNKNGKISLVGTGQKIYIKIEADNGESTIHSADYSIMYQKATTTKIEKPAKVTGVSVSTGKTKQLKVKWKKVSSASGYQLMYATSKKFKSGKKIVTIKKNSQVSKTLTTLKKGKKYYVKVRAYKKVNGKTVYGSWSSVKTKKCK